MAREPRRRSFPRRHPILSGLVVLIVGFVGWSSVNSYLNRPEREDIAPVEATPVIEPLRPVAAFASLPDEASRSVALFNEAGRVIQHPRCMNCHPVGDRPTQGDRMTPHEPWVTRGPDGHGAPGLECKTCHGFSNFEPSGVPGDPHWALAPASMAWQGKTLGEICRQIKDRTRNGDRSLDDIVHHMAEDGLVGWAWRPGGDRTPAPGTQEAFGALIRAWVETGAECPADASVALRR